MSGRHFKRLGWIIGVPEAGDYYRRRAEALLRVAVDHDTPDLDLRNAAAILERLATSPAAMAALHGSQRRGPKGGHKLDIAIDALAQCELEGPGKTDAAYLIVAQAWKVTPGSVKNMLTTALRKSARLELEALINNLVAKPGGFRRQLKGSPPEYWTREELLRAVSLDIRDINGCDVRLSRKKRVSKKKTKEPRS